MHFSTIVAVLGLAAASKAHVVISTPLPFKESVTTNSNGPLAEDGSDYPCKSGGTYTPQGPNTEYALGSTNPIVFKGSAVHGGGSCQISITYDKNPTKDSVFKVIHSIEGGCPMRNIDGNNGNDANQLSPSEYTFTVPDNLPTGDAVLAWTWFNTVGNREMYMNCAPITITGGSTRRDEEAISARNASQLVERDISAYNALPDIFKANIGNGCKTVEGQNLIFPNPGSSVEKNEGTGKFPLTEASAECKAINGGSSNPAPSQPAPSASSAPATSAAPTKTSLPGGVFFPTAGDEVSTPAATATATATSVSSAPAITSVEQPAPTVQPTTLTVIPTKATSSLPAVGTGTGGVLTGSCSQEGQWNCIDGTSFQRCASGAWSVAQPVSAGTTCSVGQGSSFEIHAIGSKRRAIRFSGAHIRRHLRSS